MPINAGSKHFDARAMSQRGYSLSDLKATIPTLEDLEYWFSNGDRRLAIICKDVTCLDFDHPALYRKFKELYPTFCYTWTVRSPKGVHLYYQVNDHVGKIECNWNNVEIKYGGQAIITAGDGYHDMGSGALNDFTMLRIESALTLPIVSKADDKSALRDSHGRTIHTESEHHNRTERIQAEAAGALGQYVKPLAARQAEITKEIEAIVPFSTNSVLASLSPNELIRANGLQQFIKEDCQDKNLMELGSLVDDAIKNKDKPSLALFLRELPKRVEVTTNDQSLDLKRRAEVSAMTLAIKTVLSPPDDGRREKLQADYAEIVRQRTIAANLARPLAGDRLTF